MFTQEKADAICARLAEGESLNAICKDADMPGIATIMVWLRKYEDFRQRYAVARQLQAEYLIDEMVEIADDAANDWMDRFYRTGEFKDRVVDREHVLRSKLRVDARSWIIPKLHPKKYGEKQHIEHTGTVSTIDLNKAGTDDLEQLERILSAISTADGSKT